VGSIPTWSTVFSSEPLLSFNYFYIICRSVAFDYSHLTTSYPHEYERGENEDDFGSMDYIMDKNRDGLLFFQSILFSNISTTDQKV